ncbi:MAG: hypothetical protein ACOC15_03115 [Desulfovibrionales bacterium]
MTRPRLFPTGAGAPFFPSGPVRTFSGSGNATRRTIPRSRPDTIKARRKAATTPKDTTTS